MPLSSCFSPLFFLRRAFFLLGLLLSSGAFADTPFSSSATQTATNNALVNVNPVPSAAIFQVIFGLFLVVCLLLGIVFFVRRFNLGKAFGGKGPLKVVGGLMLGTKERIVLLEVEDTWLVVGIVPGQIKTLHCLKKGLVEEPAKTPPFGALLKKFSERNLPQKNEKNADV